MKLNTIKLNGFKSFADQTTCKIPSQMVGIVGPNGCGKSNIIDGIRWVLGEGRAQELRGESMQDVIFNGSTQRKPAHRSSVELIFNNHNGAISGTWANYQEISVKRTLDRNSKSAYFINQTEVRRKDIQEMFLGTGLGPRAYAIIGQGMINRLLEAKPDELRIFLEEAANISKYKERRKESLQRINSTQENLSRLHDIIHELTAQQEKLSEQAIKAQKYLELQEKQKELEQKITLLNWQQTQYQQQKIKIVLEQQKLIEEQQQQQLNQFETQLFDTRFEQGKNQEQLQELQQSLNIVNQKIIQQENQIALEEQQIKQLQEQLTQTTQQLLDLKHTTTSLETEHQTFQHKIDELNALKDGLQEKISIIEDEIADFSTHHLLPNELNDLKITTSQLEYKLIDNQKQYNQKQQELLKIDDILEKQNQQEIIVEPKALEKQHLQGILFDAHRILSTIAEDISQVQQTLPELAQKIEKNQYDYRDILAQESQYQGRLEALESFSSAFDMSLTDWLEKQELGHLIPLSTFIKPEKGWERAIAKTLQERLESILLPKTSHIFAFSNLKKELLPQQSFALVSAQYYDELKKEQKNNIEQSLFSKIIWKEVPNHLIVLQNQWKEILASSHWLGGIVATENLNTNTSIHTHINSQGNQYNHGVLSFNVAVDNVALHLERQQQTHDLQKALAAQKLLKTSIGEQLQELLYSQKELQSREQSTLKIKIDAQKQEQEAQFLLKKWEQDFEYYKRLQIQKNQGQHHLTEQKKSLEEDLEILENRFIEFDEMLAIAQQRLSDLIIETEKQEEYKQTKRQLLQQIEQKKRFIEQECFEIEKKSFAKTALFEYQQQQILVLEVDIERLNLEVAEIQEQQKQKLQQHTSEDLTEHSQKLLAQRFDLEEQLELQGQIRQNQESQIQSINTQQSQLRQLWYQQQNHVRQLMVDLQGFEVKLQQMVEQFSEIGLSPDIENPEYTNKNTLYLEIQEGLAQGTISLPQLIRDKNQILQMKQNLGVVNLLSIEEIKAVVQRLDFLITERTDIENAILDLENAITTIDNESRTVLQHTFDTVNEHLNILFPKLFGGGQAYLTQIGDDILDAGVQVMAQPPGKKNSSIYLLSGGEKALTATALVFSFFMLNPAPFCLLDEVDAPLDDANTHRLFEMVASMSDKTQFVFISHNKIAMEMADHLIGITMAEKGVSRVVSVDLTEFQNS